MKTLSSIHIYPVKSCKGIKLESEGIDKKKASFDR
ncbi:MOSC N-terminal beta barrel domain-containing protein [Criblamydia sequanensis]